MPSKETAMKREEGQTFSDRVTMAHGDGHAVVAIGRRRRSMTDPFSIFSAPTPTDQNKSRTKSSTDDKSDQPSATDTAIKAHTAAAASPTAVVDGSSGALGRPKVGREKSAEYKSFRQCLARYFEVPSDLDITHLKKKENPLAALQRPDRTKTKSAEHTYRRRVGMNPPAKGDGLFLASAPDIGSPTSGGTDCRKSGSSKVERKKQRSVFF